MSAIFQLHSAVDGISQVAQDLISNVTFWEDGMFGVLYQGHSGRRYVFQLSVAKCKGPYPCIIYFLQEQGMLVH